MIDLHQGLIYIILPNRPPLKLNMQINNPSDLISMEVTLDFYQKKARDGTTTGKLNFIIDKVEVVYGCILCYGIDT